MTRVAALAAGLLGLATLTGYFGWESFAYVPPEADGSPALPGTFYPSQGNAHLPDGARFDGYASDPPTSGPHWVGAGAVYMTAGGRIVTIPPAWGLYDEELPNELLVHSMEHGGVVGWYSVPAGCDAGCVATLRGLFARYAAHGRHVILVPAPRLDTPVVLTAWTRLERLRGADAVAIERFVVAHDRRYDPEGR